MILYKKYFLHKPIERRETPYTFVMNDDIIAGCVQYNLSLETSSGHAITFAVSHLETK